MQPFLAHHVLEEEVGEDPFADEPALEIREHAQDGVDLAGVGELFELLRIDHALRLHRSSPEMRRGGGQDAHRPS